MSTLKFVAPSVVTKRIYRQTLRDGYFHAKKHELNELQMERDHKEYME